MYTSFGALIRYRRRTLGLTPSQLDRRMAAAGHADALLELESGQAGPLPYDSLVALANALEWRVGILLAANDLMDNDPEPPRLSAKITWLRPEDQLDMIREEVAGLYDLHQVLREWTRDLSSRVVEVRSRFTSVPEDSYPQA